MSTQELRKLSDSEMLHVMPIASLRKAFTDAADKIDQLQAELEEAKHEKQMRIQTGQPISQSLPGVKMITKALTRNVSPVYHIANGQRVEGAHAGLSGDVTRLSGDVTRLSGNVTGLSGDVSGLSGYVSGLSGDVSGLRGYVSGLFGNVSGLSGDVSGLSGYVSGLFGDVSSLSGNVSGLRGNVTGLSGDVSGLSGNVSGLSGDVSGLSGDLDACGLTDADRMAGVDVADLVGGSV